MSGRRERRGNGQTAVRKVEEVPEDKVAMVPNYNSNVQRPTNGLVLNNVHFLSQDSILMACFYICLVHFWCQMTNLYKKEYYYWNWRQFAASSSGILNIYASFTAERKKQTLKSIFESIWHADRKFDAFFQQFWVIVESDELNRVFSNFLMVIIGTFTFDASVTPWHNKVTALNWILMIVLMNLRVRDTFIPRSVCRLLSSIPFCSISQHVPGESLCFLLDLLWALAITTVSSVAFATLCPMWSSYTLEGSLFVAYEDIVVVVLSLTALLIPLLSMHIYHANRVMIHTHLRTLRIFYQQPPASTRMTLMDRCLALSVNVAFYLVSCDVHTVSISKGSRLSLSLWSLVVYLTIYMSFLILYRTMWGTSKVLLSWASWLIVCLAGTIVAVVWNRPMYRAFSSTNKDGIKAIDEANNTHNADNVVLDVSKLICPEDQLQAKQKDLSTLLTVLSETYTYQLVHNSKQASQQSQRQQQPLTSQQLRPSADLLLQQPRNDNFAGAQSNSSLNSLEYSPLRSMLRASNALGGSISDFTATGMLSSAEEDQNINIASSAPVMMGQQKKTRSAELQQRGSR